MPLIRPNDLNELSSAFRRFCSRLEDCIRRDAEFTEAFFTNTGLNVNRLADNFGTAYISPDFRSRMLTEGMTPSAESVNRFREKIEEVEIQPIIKVLKETILCAFELTNRNHPNRINKQQLYAFLFCLGLPTGLIAKIILNGETAGVRNGINRHAQFCISLLSVVVNNQRRTEYERSFFGNINVGSTLESRIILFTMICYRVGGLNLYRKLINQEDQFDVLTSATTLGLSSSNAVRQSLIKYIILDGDTTRERVFYVNLKTIFGFAFTSERGVRRTGQTLSRNAVDLVQLERSTALPSASNTPRNSEVRSSVSSEQSTPITTPTRSTSSTPVRDEPLQETIGVEFEIVRPKEVPYREFINNVVRKFRENGLDVQAEGYNHQTRSYWKLVDDGSISRQGGESLRGGGDAGVECVSPILKGKKGIVDIKKAIRSLVGAGASINESVGYHAHFGIGGLSIEHLRNLLYNYRGFEPIIDTIMLKNRRGAVEGMSESRWAKSLYRKYSNENDFWQLLESCQTISDIQSRVFALDRYQKTNLMAYGRYGTIEFRQHGGTLEEDTIIYWLYWLHYLIQVSKRKKLSFFDFKQVRNITPVWLSTWMGNRSFDMSGENFNAV